MQRHCWNLLLVALVTSMDANASVRVNTISQSPTFTTAGSEREGYG